MDVTKGEQWDKTSLYELGQKHLELIDVLMLIDCFIDFFAFSIFTFL